MSDRRRVAIVGGGMAGLTAAWQLSGGPWRDGLESITVYERSGVLGGKGASTRGIHGRIEEHGLHVWLGYYDNAFRVLRDVYAALDRPSSDPDCPIVDFDDAFVAAPSVGVYDDDDDAEWSAWIGRFAHNALEIGTARAPTGSATVSEFVRRAVEMLGVVATSLQPAARSAQVGGVRITTSAVPPRASGDAISSAGIGTALRRAELSAVAAGVHALSLLARVVGVSTDDAAQLVVAQLRDLRTDLLGRVLPRQQGRQLGQLVDLVAGCAQAALEDDLLRGDGFARIDHLDFREWLGDRVERGTLDSPIVRGLYDLVFAYQGGDRSRPRFSAGLGLFLANRLFFEYRGSIFWKMRAGMGDVVFAPMYQALQARGVQFAFFHRLERIGLDGRSVARLDFSCPVADRATTYAPLTRVRGLPCFSGGPAPVPIGDAAQVELRSGRDFDTVILAVPVGVLPAVAGELIERDAAWKTMVDAIGTVATQAVQLWLDPTERALGAAHPGATVSGYAPPFDTYSSMSHLVDVEDWPAGSQPGTIGYFCGALDDDDAADPANADAVVRTHAAELIANDLGAIWPAAVATDSVGVYVRANTDPSDRYVQSLPGTGARRLRADQSGLDNLALAGDWINCGMNAGCIESAAMAGIQAANVVLGRPLTDDLAGRWYGLSEDEVVMEGTS